MAKTADRPERDRSTADAAWMVTGHLLAGMLFYGGLGWLLSLWLGHTSAFVAGGMIIGIGLSLYLVHFRLSQSAPVGSARRPKRNSQDTIG